MKTKERIILNHNRRVLLPMILVSVVCLLLVLYSYYAMAQHPSGAHVGPPKGMPQPNHKKGFDFELLGNIAIAFGAISYWWLLFKKKLTSPSPLLKKLGKRIYSVHTYAGWISLVLVAIHGAYYLFTKFNHPKTLTGVAGFLLLLALVVYGWLYRRVKNKFMRTSHFILSNLWLVALVIHAGSFFIFMVAVTVVLWAGLWLAGRGRKQESGTQVT